MDSASSSPSSPSTPPSPTKITLFASVVGLHPLVIKVDLYDSIATLLDVVQARLRRIELPDDVSVCLARHEGAWLRCTTSEYRAIVTGDDRAAHRYFTPANRLDPTKTVADYIGPDAFEDPEALHLVCQFSAAAKAALAANKPRSQALAELMGKYFAVLDALTRPEEKLMRPKEPTRTSQATRRRTAARGEASTSHGGRSETRGSWWKDAVRRYKASKAD